ncbi:ATP-binding cassette domain-containing protein, partial [Enterococcus faecium]|uniref:ATP-binding cassette domain-containing protein n=1 Tax=Enterococcus faecium TaxID=1352 RepID=UPI003CC5ABFF
MLFIRDRRKSFGENEVLKVMCVSVNKGEVVTIIGSSGSVKSTFLRCINLMEKTTGGEFIYYGENLLAPKFNLPK